MSFRSDSRCQTASHLTCFRQSKPGSTQGPRIWNSQVLGYAAYRGDDMELIGDPNNVLFTDMLRQRFAWKGPLEGPGEFDHLPLVLQVDPEGPPKMFEIPETYWEDVSPETLRSRPT